jgi:hypothetical protein
MSSPFRPKKRGQFEPLTSTSGIDCVCAVTGQLVNVATVDAKWPDHAAIRKASGIVGRGISYIEAENAAAKFGVKLAARYGLSRTQVVDNGDADIRFGISVDAGTYVNTIRHTGTFTGPHTLFVEGHNVWPGGEKCACEKATTLRHGEFTIDDPGTTTAGYQQWSEDLVIKAALARTGGNGINILTARDTEGVLRVSNGTPLYDSPFRSSKLIRTLASGLTANVTSTFNGGGWPRADGTTAYGWHRVPGDLYAPGKGLR